jgi:hypothetical protein
MESIMDSEEAFLLTGAGCVHEITIPRWVVDANWRERMGVTEGLNGRPNVAYVESFDDDHAVYRVSGWPLVDVLRVAPSWFDDRARRFAVQCVALVLGSLHNDRMAAGGLDEHTIFVSSTSVEVALCVVSLPDGSVVADDVRSFGRVLLSICSGTGTKVGIFDGAVQALIRNLTGLGEGRLEVLTCSFYISSSVSLIDFDQVPSETPSSPPSETRATDELPAALIDTAGA